MLPSGLMFRKVPMLPAVAIALLLAGNCGAASHRHPYNQGKLPVGSKMIEALCGVDVLARQLVIQSAEWRHTVVVFVYPIASKHLWIWDPDSKSIDTENDPDDPLAIARSWVAAMVPGETVSEAFFLPGSACTASQ